MSLILAPFVLVVGGTIGALIAAIVPVRGGPVMLYCAASASGALTAFFLLKLMFGPMPIMFLVGACSGLAAAVVWWRMINAKEFTDA